MNPLKLLARQPDYAVIVKPQGMDSEAVPGQENVPAALSALLACPEKTIHPVHRLDRPTGGVMVYALSGKGAAALSRSLLENRFEKEYFALTERAPDEPEGKWTDLLYWDPRSRKAYVVSRSRKGVREAVLSYRVEGVSASGPALLRIRLETGRTHQIRVQCASRGLPLVGDRRYGSRIPSPRLGLWCYSLKFPDPVTGELLSFSCPPPSGPPWDAFF